MTNYHHTFAKNHKIKKSSFKKALFYFPFFIILLIGFSVRIWNLDKNPAGFFCDEASIGYNAYSILKTGKDEWGVSYPLLFRAFNSYKDPVFIYSTVPFIKIFGLNEFAVRLASLFYGTLAIVTIFFLAKEIFNKTIGLLSALFLAISPWHIHFSRVAFELISSTFWLPLAIFLLLKTVKIKKFSWVRYLITIILFFISFFTYYPIKIIAPLIFIGVFVLFLEKTKHWLKRKSFWLINFFILTLFLLLLSPYLGNGSFLARWHQVKNQSLTISYFLVGYLNHFSLDFLFKKGDIDFPGQFITRHSVKGIGELYWFQLPLIIYGLYSLFKLSKFKKERFLMMVFFLVYPLGTIFTDIKPQATRSVFGVIPFQILTAFGFYQFILLFKNKLYQLVSTIIIFSFIFFSFFQYLNLLKNYPLYSSDFWGFQYGPREIMRYFLKEKDNYDEFYLTIFFNAPYIFLKFYDPENLCQNKCKVGDVLLTPKIYNFSKHQLFSVIPWYLKNSKFKDKFKIKKIIYYPNGQEAFYIGEIVDS